MFLGQGEVKFITTTVTQRSQLSGVGHSPLVDLSHWCECGQWERFPSPSSPSVMEQDTFPLKILHIWQYWSPMNNIDAFTQSMKWATTICQAQRLKETKRSDCLPLEANSSLLRETRTTQNHNDPQKDIHATLSCSNLGIVASSPTSKTQTRLLSHQVPKAGICFERVGASGQFIS